MNNVEKHLHKVRYRNAGDDFHELWAARKILCLIDPRNDLVAVSIEGISEREKSGSKAGLLVVDMAEYFGGEAFENARRVIYSQLKHSTTNKTKNWSAGELGEVIDGFANRFKELVKIHGSESVKTKVRFQFVTNRPISPNVIAAIEAAANENVDQLIGHASKAFKTIKMKYGSADENFTTFLKLLILTGKQRDRHGQEIGLEQDVQRLIADFDANVRLRLKNLVRKMTLPEYRDDPTIRKDDLLAALDIVSEKQLFPAPTRFEFDGVSIPREQEADIVKDILGSSVPVVIHASGGIGKSVVAIRLPGVMPEGSACVVFDGFAGGEYKIERVPRHQHRYGLVQLANELAVMGLCDPLLPSSAQPTAYIEAFRVRLKQASVTVRSVAPDAMVLVVLDAADNSVMAASESHDRPFVHGLMQEPPPDGCRIVVLARTERLDMLDMPEDCCIINLEPFSLAESAKHLRQKFPDADDIAVQRFHQLTSQNPRVQAYELVRADSLPDLLGNLGPNEREVDDVIAEQVHKALNHIRRHSPSQLDIDRLCLSLAVLPPMVPIRLLAKAASIQEAAVRSFVADMGHPLLIRDDSVQFRDEPVETWFRDTFFTEDADFKGLADTLFPLAETDSYVAIILPRVLYNTGRYEALMSLALRDDGPDDESVIERRDIVLRRVQYAMKAMLREGRVKDVMKLLLRAAEEVASKDRQGEFLMKNGALVASLVEPGVLPDLVFRKHASYWSGVRLVYRAAILASHPQYRAEAYGFFRQALIWLKDWSLLPDKKRREQELTNENIACFVLTAFHLDGAKAALDELKGWRPRRLMFDVGRIVVRSLIDLNDKSSVMDFVQAARKQIRLLLAAVIELDEIGKFIPLREATQIAQALLRVDQEKPEGQERGFSQIQMAIITVAESLAFYGQATLGRHLLERYLPELPRYLSTALSGEPYSRILTLRAYTLHAALRGKDLTSEDLIPETVKKEHDRGRNRRELNKCYSVLLPWFKIRTKVITGELKEKELEECMSVSAASRGDDYEERAYGLHDIDQVIARTWMSTLVIGGIATEDKIIGMADWLVSRRSYVQIPTWTYLARMAAHCGEASGATLELAAKAAEIVEVEHMSASVAAELCADLSKAVLPVSREEAQGYLNRGFEILDRLDDEARHRLELLFVLARNAGKECTAEPKEAYRLAQVAELVHAYNDHKFPWPYAAASLAELCPSSALAIISRWRDRGQGWLSEALPAATKRLAEKGEIAPGVVIALNVLGQHWRFGEVVKAILKNERDPHLRQNILEMLERDLEIEGCSEHTAREVIDGLPSVGMTSDRIAKMIVPPNVQLKDGTKNAVSPITTRAREMIEWDNILDGSVFVTAEEVDQTVRTFRDTCNYYPWEELFKRMRRKVPVSRRSDHIAALASSHELSIRLILDALKQSREEWHRFSSVKRAIPKVTKSLLDRCGAWFISSYLLSRDIADVAVLAEQPKPQLLHKLVEVAINYIDDISAEGLQAIVMEYSEHLTPTECLDILKFALDRFQLLLTEDDGDGPWTPDKGPDCTFPEAVAGMLWAFLAAPESELRWKAVHAVRRLCVLKQQDVVDALISRLGNSQCTHFTDKRFPFYHLHGRLYALIAFARAAHEVPEVLSSHAEIFAEYALQGPPHVLIRHFASQAALTLEVSHPGTFDDNRLSALQKVNNSPFSYVKGERYSSTANHWARRENARFVFNHDIENGWFRSLANAFDGVTKSDVAECAEAWIVDEWGIENAWGWKDDPRANFGLYRERTTWAGKHSYPNVDRYSFYLTLHAMFCVAGQLQQEKQIVVDEWRENLWEYWLKDHILTRKDGSWLADRRDPIPQACQPVQHETYDPNWRWSVNVSSFDDILWPPSEGDHEITVWGSWQINDGYGQRENVHTRSALVSPKTSLALLRALQTCENPADYRIPSAKDEIEIHKDGYHMTGWVRWDNKERGLDALDSLSGDIYYPPPMPRLAISRIMKLEKSLDDRNWQRISDSSVIMRSEIWGAWTRDDSAERSDNGGRLIAKVDFVLDMLSRLKRDLIIEVQIDRDTRSKEEYVYVPPYTRIFVLKSNGTLCVLEGCRRIGASDSEGAGA